MKKQSFILTILFIIVTITLPSCLFFGEPKPLGKSFRIFNGTPAKKAATAIKFHNMHALERELKKNPEIINLRDPYYGQTLLMLATINDRKDGVRVLLENGADPNAKRDSITNKGATALYLACDIYDPSPEIVKMLLEHGADPNFITPGVIKNGDKYSPWHKSVLSNAAGNSLEKVKLLVEYGANVNKSPLENKSSPLKESIWLDKMDITLFLLEHGADYNEKFKIYGGDEEYWIDISEALRSNIYDLDSKEYRDKMKVVEFLKEHGIDYRSSPIPERWREQIIRRYPDNYEYYLSVY